MRGVIRTNSWLRRVVTVVVWNALPTSGNRPRSGTSFWAVDRCSRTGPLSTSEQLSGIMVSAVTALGFNGCQASDFFAAAGLESSAQTSMWSIPTVEIHDRNRSRVPTSKQAGAVGIGWGGTGIDASGFFANRHFHRMLVERHKSRRSDGLGSADLPQSLDQEDGIAAEDIGLQAGALRFAVVRLNRGEACPELSARWISERSEVDARAMLRVQLHAHGQHFDGHARRPASISATTGRGR